MKIALIHTTVNSMSPIIKAFNKIDATIELMNFLDEGLMSDLKKNSPIEFFMLKRIITMAENAEKSGADGILLACSAFSPYVDVIKDFVNIPLLSADMAMLEKVVSMGGKIGVLTTIEAARSTTLQLIKELGDKNKTTVEVEGEIVYNAFDELKNGNKNQHDRLIQNKIKEFSSKYDVIVLAQMSMNGALESLDPCNKPIFSSPEISARKILEEIKEERVK
ncbi:aspartate/glutamate racemase family protein [Ilyobacter polytropus]|uniref:Asp/Glu/hydantoin racemase n=1 Tax=Ilyobacter polytropus (strain ATCC 51220 / DSM 2926 / LMG 16218 / CuHBu1) TaxID=572544 RepID=E3HBU8_ILYPC|nr:aspartate/glutamate racemase family protein [Ilyobacter polytropus]ADO83860.1 Asp/Glu/hydantoin racemase [Ilyobacter polytropus DSM 2926]